MKMVYPVLAALLVTSCSTTQPNATHTAANFIQRQHVAHTTQNTYPAKNPQQIAMYSNELTPHRAYRVIGVASISKYNLLGVQRQEATMHSMLKDLAASIGGDGVMDVHTSEQGIKGNVIAFQKVLI